MQRQSVQRGKESEDLLAWCLDTLADLPVEIKPTSTWLYNELCEDAPGNIDTLLWTETSLAHLLTRQGKDSVVKIQGNRFNGGTSFFCLRSRVREYLNKKHEKVFIVNRIDKETSGLVVFAKTEDIKNKLQNNWDDVKRVYVAVVEGKTKDKGIIKSFDGF